MNLPFSTSLPVRIGDINYGNHMGNDRFLLYFQEARLRFLATMGMSEREIAPGTGLIMTEAHLRYLGQVAYGDTLEVTVSVASIQKVRFVLRYIARSRLSGTPVAEGETTLAAFDYANNRPVRIPEAVVGQLGEHFAPSAPQ